MATAAGTRGFTGPVGGAASSRGTAARERLIGSAIEAIAEHGWLGVTARGIADRAGMNPALVHYYFGSVDSLRRAAAEHAVQASLHGPLGELLKGVALPQGVSAVLRALGELDPQDPPIRVVLEASLYATHDSGLAGMVTTLIEEFRSLLATQVEQAVAAGSMRPVDPRAAAALLAALIDGVGLHWLLSPDLDLGAVAQAIEALLAPCD